VVAAECFSHNQCFVGGASVVALVRYTGRNTARGGPATDPTAPQRMRHQAGFTDIQRGNALHELS